MGLPSGRLLLPCIALILLGAVHALSDAERKFSSLIEKCQFERQWLKKDDRPPLQTLEGLVGTGWDNLRDVPMGIVLDTNFTFCRTTPDGLYFIADNVEVLPIKDSHLDLVAEFHTTVDSYESQHKQTVNMDAHVNFLFVNISGSYSNEHTDIRTNFIQKHSSMFYTALQYRAYTLLTQPGTGFHPTFVELLHEIDDALERNLTRRARYLAEVGVRNFGTHVITNVDVGALVEAMDFVDNSTINSNTTNIAEMKAAASISLSGSLWGSNSSSIGGGIGRSSRVSESTWHAFSTGKTHSTINTHGGPDVNRLLKYGWDSNSKEALFVDGIVPLDRSGEPLYTLVTPSNLPGVRFERVIHIQKLFFNATYEYYRRNTVPGCMNPLAPNYNWLANFDDGKTCHTAYFNFTFGGVFQSCDTSINWDDYCNPSTHSDRASCDAEQKRQETCGAYLRTNPATGKMNCPENYEPVLLATDDDDQWETETDYSPCNPRCCDRRFYILWCIAYCYDKCEKTTQWKVNVHIETFWCRAQPGVVIRENQGFLFGGIYTDTTNNPLIGRPGCAGNFQSLPLGTNIHVCVSREYDNDAQFTAPFGGFFSCLTPSGLQKCPENYTMHFAGQVNHCDISYCVRPEYFHSGGKPFAVRPPYEDPSVMYTNESESVVEMRINGQLWFKKPARELLSLVRKDIQSVVPHKQLLKAFDGGETSQIRLLRLWTKYLRGPNAEAHFGDALTSDWLKHTSEWLPLLNVTETPSRGNTLVPGWYWITLGLLAVVIAILLVFVALVAVSKFRNKRRSPGYRTISGEGDDMPLIGVGNAD